MPAFGIVSIILPLPASPCYETPSVLYENMVGLPSRHCPSYSAPKIKTSNTTGACTCGLCCTVGMSDFTFLRENGNVSSWADYTRR